MNTDDDTTNELIAKARRLFNLPAQPGDAVWTIQSTLATALWALPFATDDGERTIDQLINQAEFLDIQRQNDGERA